MFSIQAEAQINPDVVRGLIPHVNIMKSYLDRLFPGEEASEVQHNAQFEYMRIVSCHCNTLRTHYLTAPLDC